MVARAIVQRLKRLGMSIRRWISVARLEFRGSGARAFGDKTPRTPYFCSGCPHNTSTKIPDGSRAMAGIGCHGMALSIPARNTTITHMGGEGANWIGRRHSPTSRMSSRIWATAPIRIPACSARASAGGGGRANITYKISQRRGRDDRRPAGRGGFTVSQIAHQVVAEGAKKLAIVTDDPENIRRAVFPHGATVHHRANSTPCRRTCATKGLTV